VSRLVGGRVRRVEDPRVLTGGGRYVDDIRLDGMLHAAFVRSPHAHANVRRIDTSRARTMPGVHGVFTAADFAGKVQHLQPMGPTGHATPAHPVLAADRVRFVGDPVVVVIAESRALAEDACDRIDVDYEPLEATVTIEQALDDTRTPLFPEVGSNLMYRQRWTYGDLDGAFAGAHEVIEATFVQHRHTNAPMEGRGAVAEFRPASGELLFHAAHQNPHALRMNLAMLLGIDAHRVTVRCGDIGGSFGQKAYVAREEVAIAAASMALGRPVKWIEDRAENLMTAGQARDEEMWVQAAVAADGTILGVKVRMTCDQGAYQLTTLPSTVYCTLARVLFPNCYRIRNYEFEAVVVASNKATYVAYRGPWEMETWVRERLVETIAHRLGIEPYEVRRKNILNESDFPTEMVTGPTVTNLTAWQTHEGALEAADIPGFRRRQAEARAQGRYLGVGFSTFMEHAPGPPNFSQAMGASASPRTAQRAVARLEPDGSLTVFTSQMPHGQSHETTLAQLAADGLGVPMERVKVIAGDTGRVPFNLVGTGGSRAGRLASGAVIGAVAEVRQRVVDIYAHIKEVAADDVVVDDGQVQVKGVPSSAMPLSKIAAAGYTATALLPPDMAPGFECTYDFGIPDGGWSQATHVCFVEVDALTGEVTIDRYLTVEDCGKMINPAVVEGQVRGGIVQGIGGVLLERVVYGPDGQFLTTTFMDYLLPTATGMPRIECDHLESTPEHPVDHRGVGEGGAVGAPAAVTNAIEDALAPFGVEIREQHLPPARILELIGVIPVA
jgi:carbon-monoxide dehydrogenase large subunit